MLKALTRGVHWHIGVCQVIVCSCVWPSGIENEQSAIYYVAPETEVCARCKRQCIALDQEVQVPSSTGGIHECQKAEQGDWYTEMVKPTQFCVRFIALWSQSVSFQAPKSCHFLNRSLFRCSPMVMSLGQWLKQCYFKCKRQRWHFCEELTV